MQGFSPKQRLHIGQRCEKPPQIIERIPRVKLGTLSSSHLVHPDKKAATPCRVWVGVNFTRSTEKEFDCHASTQDYKSELQDNRDPWGATGGEAVSPLPSPCPITPGDSVLLHCSDMYIPTSLCSSLCCRLTAPTSSFARSPCAHLLPSARHFVVAPAWSSSSSRPFMLWLRVAAGRLARSNC